MNVSLLFSSVVHRFALGGRKCWILQLLEPSCPVRREEHGLVGGDPARKVLIVPWELQWGGESLVLIFF